ncbi:MAG: hypothetical protein JW920_06070 [Deltaproteobacteria bacterium]|nr:hypothetical protein [Deltaproteobacteria bacterium]
MADRDMLTNRIILRSVLPLFKVLYLADETPIKKLLLKFDGVIQFGSHGSENGAYLEFKQGNLDVIQGLHPNPEIAIIFKNIQDMNALFTGGKPKGFPTLKGLWRIPLLLRLVPLFIGLTMLQPNAQPKDPKKRELKVRLLMYMVTNALSQLNKGGDEDMQVWTKNQPDRIYQMSVQPEGPAAYMRVKGGKTKSGHGIYKRKAPFVHMKFNGLDSAYKVMAEGKETIQAMRDLDISLEGPPEYSGNLGSFMVRIQDLMMP